jgi:arginine/ornithine transport system ATP-binding protein
MSAIQLQATNIHKRFGEREVLKGISLRRARATWSRIIGSSGSGKSTLLRCLNLLEQPNEALSLGGEARLVRDRDGSLRPPTPSTCSAGAARLAMVFQNFNLWPT